MRYDFIIMYDFYQVNIKKANNIILIYYYFKYLAILLIN